MSMLSEQSTLIKRPTYTIMSNTIQFTLGKLLATPAALELMEQHNINPAILIARYLECDWGDLCPADRMLNARALRDGSRLMGVYRLVSAEVLATTPTEKRADLPTIWIISDAAIEQTQPTIRQVTTLLRPEDY